MATKQIAPMLEKLLPQSLEFVSTTTGKQINQMMA
jgi:hypothetical protein